MQAEEIIQTKEWQQLTEAERKFIGPLAATEGEYNVLKKMLLVAKEDAADVPFINPSIQQNLHAYLAKPQRKKSFVFWYAAAASIILFIVAAFFLWQPKKQENIAVSPTKNEMVKQHNIDTPFQKQNPIITILPNDSTNIVKQQNDSLKKLPPGKTRTHEDLQAMAKINTSVNENAELLAFVTEVY